MKKRKRKSTYPINPPFCHCLRRSFPDINTIHHWNEEKSPKETAGVYVGVGGLECFGVDRAEA
jgi:hypothetical protein